MNNNPFTTECWHPHSSRENALVLSDRANFRIVGPGSKRQSMTLHAGYAVSRISSRLKGSTKQFGWLQAPATNRARTPRRRRARSVSGSFPSKFHSPLATYSLPLPLCCGARRISLTCRKSSARACVTSLLSKSQSAARRVFTKAAISAGWTCCNVGEVFSHSSRFLSSFSLCSMASIRNVECPLAGVKIFV
jgi:hypothetical protein